MNELDLLRRNAGISEAVAQELMDQVIMQIKQDCDTGDYTAIEELINDIPEDKLRGFLSEIDESKNINEDSKMIKVRVINSGYRTDMGIKDAEIISQELDQRMMPILKVRIKDVNMGCLLYTSDAADEP